MLILGVTFKEFIQRGNVILGIVLAILGVGFWLLAKSIAHTVRKTDDIKPNDAILIGVKVFGLVLVLVGMILIALPM